MQVESMMETIIFHFTVICNKLKPFFYCFQVVQNKNISKTQKVRFFTAEMLNHIASLYRWNGITDVSIEDVKVWSFLS